ncbi:hypothetical protein [Pseudomonas oryzihabitans]|uniref:hypothetical protein n=1 Tax=Pseudomonas oryzihabitans TaxID=47885 RepID=UPI0015E2826E|nr:hypothetical protein [Pseudomonas psychrotolerans]MBA1212953.1 hypothetical protein [Pseudomonas psychrotolerans]
MATLAARVTALAQAVAADVKAILSSLGDKAGKGANSDITSLSGLTTPLSVAQGGTGNTNGNAATATKLATARTLSWTGDVTGSTTYDGSGNSSAAVTLAASGVSAGNYGPIAVNSKGLVTSLSSVAPAVAPTLTGPVTMNAGNPANTDNTLTVNRVLSNSAAVDIPQALGLYFTDQATGNRTSAQIFRLTYTRAATATGIPTSFDALSVMTPVINTDSAFTLRGLVMEGPVVAAGKTLRTWIAARIQQPSGGGSVTNKIALLVDAGAGNSLYGTTSDNGMDLIQVAGSFSASGPGRFGTYTLSTLPSASSYSGYLIQVSNASRGWALCRSNGTSWIDLYTQAAVA